MSKKVKLLVAVLVAVVMLTASGVATVVAQEEPQDPPPGEEETSDGLLARVAAILGISEEELTGAFKQAKQEMREEKISNFLAKAIEKGLITEEEAEEIKEWWLSRPEALDAVLFTRMLGVTDMRGKRPNAFPGKALDRGQVPEETAAMIKERWENRAEGFNNAPALRARISKAARGRQQIALPGGRGRMGLLQAAD